MAGVKLENPLVLASGVLGNTSELLIRVAKAGAGAVTTKSIGPRPNPGYRGPNIVEVSCGYVNAMGLPNPGAENFKGEIEKYKNETDTPIIASVYGSTEEDFAFVAKKLANAGADIIELNVSCPHSREGIINIGLNPRATRSIVEAVKSEVKVPVFVKMPGNTNIPSLLEVAKEAINGGVDGFTAINTLPAMAIDIETFKPLIGYGVGGLSGPAIKPVAIRIVYELRKITDLPIIGVGGVTNYRDVIEFILAGANAVGIGTALVWDPEIKIFERIKRGIKEYMINKGIKSIHELVGAVDI